MRKLVRVGVSLLVAAAFCPASFSLPPGAQSAIEAGGMGEIKAHSVRGDVTAVVGGKITVKTEEGDVYTVETGPNTRFRKERELIAIPDVHPGEMIAAVGDKNAKAHTLGAAFVMVIDKARYEQMRAGFGKTWTAGVVQSIEGTRIVIKRPDNQTQALTVDENTSFRRRREDIILPDIKPGDRINARGALRNGSFLATLVNVGRRGGAGERGWDGHRSGAHDTNTPSPGASATQPSH